MVWFRRRRKIESAEEPLPDHPRLRQIEDRLGMLRDDLDLLRLASIERSKPWFRNASNLLSITALGVSIIFGILTIRQKVFDDRVAKRAEIRELVRQLLDMQHEYYSRDSLVSDETLLEDAEFAVHEKRGVYLQEINRLELELQEPLTFREYIILADHAIEASEPLLAAEYYSRAAKQATSINDRYAAAMLQATVYFSSHGGQDVGKGRGFASQALAIAQQESKLESRHYLSAMALVKWADYEYNNQQRDVAYRKLELGLDHILQIGSTHRLRKISAEHLDKVIGGWIEQGVDLAGQPQLVTKLRKLLTENNALSN